LALAFIIVLINPGRRLDSGYIDLIGEIVFMTLMGKKLSG